MNTENLENQLKAAIAKAESEGNKWRSDTSQDMGPMRAAQAEVNRLRTEIYRAKQTPEEATFDQKYQGIIAKEKAEQEENDKITWARSEARGNKSVFAPRTRTAAEKLDDEI